MKVVEQDKECIFCKIVRGEVDSAKIWEDEKFLAILDINPNMKGMALVMTKEHYTSDIFSLPSDVYRELLDATRKVAKILEKGLGVGRVAMVAEGMGIGHVHVKLYPLHGVSKEFKEHWAEERVFFEKYEGYLSTRLGPEEKLSDLKKLAEEILKSAKG